MDLIIFHQDLQHSGRQERRQRWPEIDVFDAEVEQREQDADCFLFIPGQHQRERKIIDPAAKRICESDGDFDRAVRVIALSHIHDTGQSPYSAEVEIVETILSAGEGEHSRIGGSLFYKLCIIAASPAGTVASSDQEDVAQGAALYRVDDLIRYGQNSIVAESCRDFRPSVDPREFLIFRISAQFQSLFDDRREIFLFTDVEASRTGSGL